MNTESFMLFINNYVSSISEVINSVTVRVNAELGPVDWQYDVIKEVWCML